MKLQLTLALLCMAFCFKSSVATVKSCYVNTGTVISTDLGKSESCGGTGNSCVWYTVKNTNKHVRACSTSVKARACTDDNNAKVNDFCESCDDAADCNNKPFKLKCYLSTESTEPAANSATVDCPSGICLMHNDSTGYKRGCGDGSTDCKNKPDNSCAECRTEKCNKGAFISCNVYSEGTDPAKQGESKLCPSGTCIMYKDNSGKYIRGCTTNIGDCAKLVKENLATKDMCAECNSINCNRGKFISCHENSVDNANAPGQSKLCPSGTCIMYQNKSANLYTRGCTTNIGDCAKLVKDKLATKDMCAECNSINCNNGKFLSCYENDINGPGPADTNTAKQLCPSETCIMYKKDDDYIRGCVDEKKSCAALTGTTILCSQCKGPDCNKAKFDSVCYRYNGPSATHVGEYLVPCKLGPSDNKCLAYKEVKTGNYVRTCSTDLITCETLREAGTGKECVECAAEKCNNKPIQSECYAYSGPSRTDLTVNGGTPKECTSKEGVCIMYKDNSGKYVRDCVDAAASKKTCEDLKETATLCSECSKEKCNKDPFTFTTVCYVNRGLSTTDLGTPTQCKSGTCLSYKDGESYVRACHDSTKGLDDKQKPCTTDNCNNVPFACNCHVYEGTDKTDKGNTPTLCTSGRCIMYKDITTRKYIRGCVNDRKTCLANKETATQCDECTSENCNNNAFNTGSTFILDVRMAAIALAGSLMILRSL